MSIANPLWGAPRIHGELLKLGIEIGQTSALGCFISRGFFERAPNTFAIRTVLIERQRVSFAAFGTEEVAAIDVDGVAEPIDRVENGMNDIVLSQLRMPSKQQRRRFAGGVGMIKNDPSMMVLRYIGRLPLVKIGRAHV